MRGFIVKDITLLIIAIIMILLGSLNLSWAGTITLPKSGQTTCYDASGNTIDCGGTGQDGNTLAGVDWPAPRFTDNGNNTLTDNLTGLIWLKDANCLATNYSGVDPDGAVDWQGALNFVAGINSGTYPACGAGYAGWRLPNVNELESLVNAEASDSSWLTAQGFINLDAMGYWSSTTSTIFFPGNGVFVDLYAGAVSNTDKSDVGLILPVREGQTDGNPDINYPANIWQTGQISSQSPNDDGDIKAGVAWPNPRFNDNGDGTVTDNLTGLIWLKDANCLATNYSDIDPDGRVTWQGALNFVAGINSGTYSACGAGYADWRLPNRKEFYSLIDFSQSNPAMPSDNPFINIATASPSSYWSSTTYSSLSNWAWYFYVRYGGISGAPKTSTYWVWPVRGEYSSTIKAMPWNPLLLIID